ncbi:MAG TPA: MFS transporter [Clostridia bacterium]|nr:MFS transporter [Clostridia bacterium]
MEKQTVSIEQETKSPKLGVKSWIVIWVAGIAGQLCWNIENQWFNTFVYAKIAPNPSIITWMVAVSAIVSTLSTFISGTGSDRLGRRKPFIVVGYILWGVFTIVFGVTEFLPIKNVLAMATMVIVADAIMSFFGSLGNDAGFNPWTTDITNERNRGGLGAVIAVQPVLATIIGSLGGGFIIGALDYIWFFVIMGTFVIGVGIYSAFAVKDSPNLKPNRDEKGYWHQFGQAFNFKLLAKNKLLLIVLCIFAMFFISFNVYFPHMLNLFIYTYGYDTGMAGVLLGVGLVVAIPLTLIASKFINKQKFVPVASVAVLLNILGLIIMSLSKFAGNRTALTTTIIIATFFVGGGYMVFYQALMIWCKNLYPEEQRGQLEGVRLFFYVCIPMVLGPAIANPVIKNLGKPVTLLYDNVPIDGFAPSIELLYVSIAVAFLTFIPLYIAYRYQKNHPEVKNDAKTETETA